MNISYADIPEGVKDNYTYNKSDSSILIVKERLNELGFFGNGSVQFSDFVSEQLKNAIISFQKQNKVKADGIIDKDLLELLFSDDAIGKDGKKRVQHVSITEAPLIKNPATTSPAKAAGHPYGMNTDNHKKEEKYTDNNKKEEKKSSSIGAGIFIVIIGFCVPLLVISAKKRKVHNEVLLKHELNKSVLPQKTTTHDEKDKESKDNTDNKTAINKPAVIKKVVSELQQKKEQELHQIRITYESFTIKAELMKTIHNSSDLLNVLGQYWIEAFVTPKDHYASGSILYGSGTDVFLFYKPRYMDSNLVGNKDIEKCPPLKRLCSLTWNNLSAKGTGRESYTMALGLWGIVMNNDMTNHTVFESYMFKKQMIDLWGKIDYLFKSLMTYGLIAFDTNISRSAFYLLVYDIWYNNTLKHYQLETFKSIRLSKTMNADTLFQNMSKIDTTDFTKIYVLAEKEYFMNDGQSCLFVDLINKYQKLYDEYEEKAARKQYISDLLTKDQSVSHLHTKEQSDSTLLTKGQSVSNYSIQDTDFMSPYDFEELIAALFRSRGYEASVTKRSGDQGVDVIAKKAGERIAIQAKCYANSTVGNSAIQEVVAGMKLYNASSAFVVTNSTFTASANQLAEANNVRLIDRSELAKLLLKYPIRKS